MARSRRRVGYVAKVFPRLSETFIVSELLAQERAGLDVEVFSLRRSEDHGAHGAHARLRAPVTYVGDGEPTLGGLLAGLAEASPTGDLEAMVALAGHQHPREVAQALRARPPRPCARDRPPARALRQRRGDRRADGGGAGRHHLLGHRAREGHLP